MDIKRIIKNIVFLFLLFPFIIMDLLIYVRLTKIGQELSNFYGGIYDNNKIIKKLGELK